jgi:hypothetical protein
MLETCTLAVLGLMNSACAIWRLLRPAATGGRCGRWRGSGAQRVGDGDQDGVAGFVAPGVVDGLEVVQVDE